MFLRPYRNRDFEIGSCCQHVFFILLRWVRPWIVFLHCLRGPAKWHFIYFSRAVIILFSTGLCKSTFSTNPFGKLGDRVSVCFVLSVFYVLNSMWSQKTFKNLINHSGILFIFCFYFVKTIYSNICIVWLKSCLGRGVELLKQFHF